MTGQVDAEKEINMSKFECGAEKTTLKTLGILMLPLALFFVVVSNMLLPMAGFFLSLPVVILNVLLLSAPKSETCRILLGRDDA